MLKMKKTISLIMAIATIATMCCVFASPVSAATTFPSINSNNYIETKAEVGMPVFADSSMKTRGTSSPRKYYNASIDQWDEVHILQICGNGSVLVEYPTASGWKKGYAAFGNFFNHYPSEVFRASASADSYVAPYGSKYGRITAGDQVYCVGESNNHKLVIYGAKSNRRGYKLAYVSNSDFNNIQKTTPVDKTVSSTTSKAYITLNAMKNGTLHGITYKVNTVYKGEYASEQCKGFAKSVFKKLYGYNIGSTKSSATGSNYQLNIDSRRTLCLGSVSGMGNNAASQNNTKKLFLKASAGDFVQMRRQHGGSHSAIVFSVTEAGVTFFEANLDNRNGIVLRTYTWADLCRANYAMSIYRDK